MKPFNKKLIAGILFSICIISALILALVTEKKSGEYWMAELFLISFQFGIIIWLHQNHKESKKIKAEREKNKHE